MSHTIPESEIQALGLEREGSVEYRGAEIVVYREPSALRDNRYRYYINDGRGVGCPSVEVAEQTAKLEIDVMYAMGTAKEYGVTAQDRGAGVSE